MDSYFETAYRSLRRSAYRNKYEKALCCGGRSLTFGALLKQAEHAYNTFRQMGVEPGEPVCLCLPNSPELAVAFYGLSRLGAMGVLAHPASSPRELRAQMETAGAARLITTPARYRAYCTAFSELPPGALILCGVRDAEGESYPAEIFFDRLLRENRYSANDTPYNGEQAYAAMVFGTSCFLQARPISYTADELKEAGDAFWHRRETVRTVYIEPSFATESGLLAAHSALCTGRTVLWSAGIAPFKLLTRKQPDFLIGSEEFFFEFRGWADRQKSFWPNLQGGIQTGRPLTPLMEKFAPRAFAAVGGKGTLSACPVPLKVRQEPLTFLRDFGVRTTDIEQLLNEVPGVIRCECRGDGDRLRLTVTPAAGAGPQTLGRALIARCREEMGATQLPRTVEFRTPTRK